MSEFEINGNGSHEIISDNVLTCSETGRVVAVFYNDYDLERVIELMEHTKCHTNCVGKQACLQLVKDGKNEVLDKLEDKLNKKAYLSMVQGHKVVDLYNIDEVIASMREE